MVQSSHSRIPTEMDPTNLFNITENQYTANNPYSLGSLVCGCLIIPIAVSGIVGNSLSIYIFNRPTMTSSINLLLSGLAIFDTILLVLGTPLFSALAIYASYQKESLLLITCYLILTVYPLAMAAQAASAWSMIAITLERYLAVCWPFRARYVCNTRHAKLTVICIMFLSLLYNLVRYWEYRFDHETLVCLLQKNELYMRVYSHWMYFVTIFMLPFMVLLIFNTLIVKTIKKAKHHRLQLTRQQCREHKTAVMMIVVVMVFFFCNVLAFVLNLMERILPLHDWVVDPDGTTTVTNKVVNVTTIADNADLALLTEKPCPLPKPEFFLFLEDINNLLIELNSSVNFFIYFAFSNRFRAHFRKLWRAFTLQRMASTTESQESFYSQTSYIPMNCVEGEERYGHLSRNGEYRMSLERRSTRNL